MTTTIYTTTHHQGHHEPDALTLDPQRHTLDLDVALDWWVEHTDAHDDVSLTVTTVEPDITLAELMTSLEPITITSQQVVARARTNTLRLLVGHLGSAIVKAMLSGRRDMVLAHTEHTEGAATCYLIDKEITR